VPWGGSCCVLSLRVCFNPARQIFEWKSEEAMEEAHKIDSLKQNWETIKKLADMMPLSEVAEKK
jgi:hypothetical protein